MKFDGALRGLTAAIVAAAAALGATSVAPAAHDDGVVRAIGAGYTGAFRALDAWVASAALVLPIGTRALRAGLGTAFVAGVCTLFAFDLARELVGIVPAALDRLWRGKPTARPQLLATVVAAVTVLAFLLAPAWQTEACVAGGAVTGAAIVLSAFRVRALAGAGLVLGLAASYEPIVFAAALGAMAPRLVDEVRLQGRPMALRALVGFVLGALPLALGIALTRRLPEIALDVPLFPLFERGPAPSLRGFVLGEVGPLLAIATLLGVFLAFVVPSMRRLALSLVLVIAVGLVALALGAPGGPHRYSAVVLAALAAASVLAAPTLAALVLAITRAPVPFAEASAALVVVLELVLPVRALDETSTRRGAQAKHGAAIWNDLAWGAAPPASVLLVTDHGTMRRIASARAAGSMRDDLVVVPAYDVQGRQGQRALVREPKLAALYRDVALGIAPEELSLAQLGSQRALLANFDPKWDRALARHLVPLGLVSRFEPEPRGASDRKKALDAFTPAKERLVQIAGGKRDPSLSQATATLLRLRAVGAAATGEREVLARTLEDLRAFAPEDAVASVLVRRMVTSHGPIDVHDL